jgi:hypothetical protein
VVGLRFMPYESHNVSKSSLNSDPLSYIKYQHLGYLHNQILLTNRLIRSDDLSKISSLIILSFPLTFLVINRMAAIDAHEYQVFEKLLWGFVSSTIFVRC